ncbi:MAG: hypothetical protein SCALA702_32290 [Melioribacteraceae bacterium]|nr:MAG: hypothetical protein SCALA702_32290 [Melioribacteraceae bacterium]
MKITSLISRGKIANLKYNHLLILFLVLFLFQIGLSFIHKATVNDFLDGANNWYKKDSAERFANITTTSLELLIETSSNQKMELEGSKEEIIKSINIILSWQNLKKRVKDISLVFEVNNNFYAISDGMNLYEFIFESRRDDKLLLQNSVIAEVENITEYYNEVSLTEKIITGNDKEKRIHIAVPFSPRGEHAGMVFINYEPDFSEMTQEIIAGYDKLGLIYSTLIIFGLLIMYYISAYILKERDYAHKLYLEEHEQSLKHKIDLENESRFTKRIYHTHHKAEKIMGFIKNDISKMTDNLLKYKLLKYSNFISRVIYDMKWYDPPVNTVRNVIYNTNINEVIRFLTEHVFKRVSDNDGSVEFKLSLDENLPTVNLNEFVIWEILEPLIQNSIEHSGEDYLTVTISTAYDSGQNRGKIILEDNGAGLKPEFLSEDESGIQKIFLENLTSGSYGGRHRGYGCYIAHTMATKRCGWSLRGENREVGGSRFLIELKY